jgi:hypothetical protein
MGGRISIFALDSVTMQTVRLFEVIFVKPSSLASSHRIQAESRPSTSDSVAHHRIFNLSPPGPRVSITPTGWAAERQATEVYDTYFDSNALRVRGPLQVRADRQQLFLNP